MKAILIARVSTVLRYALRATQDDRGKTIIQKLFNHGKQL